MLWYELGQNPFGMRRQSIERFLREHTTEFVEANSAGAIRKLADGAMATRIKPKDAFHLACAMWAGCDSFPTADKRLLRYDGARMRVENPIDFIRRIEGA